MIPSDLAARLRLLAETAVQPLSAVQELPSDLPPLPPGQRFTAKLESVLPDGTFRAVVAGKTVTLSLPQAANSGDVLELVVVGRTPRLVVAAQSGAETPAQAAPLPATTLSRAGQLIGALLSRSGETPPPPASLAHAEPILPEPPQSGRVAAPLLRRAVSESGLFFEAHQAQWIAGKWPLASLLREPQGRQSVVSRCAGENGARQDIVRSMPGSVGFLSGSAELFTEDTSAKSGRTAAASAALPGLPDELAPLVRQQLELLSNHCVTWQGQIWPGQSMEWEIDDTPRERGTADAEDPQTWTTTLRLTLPRLGRIVASLDLDASGVGINLCAAERPSVEVLRGGMDELGRALAAAGLALRGSRVDHGEPT